MALEVIATILAVMVLIKIAFIFIARDKWYKVPKAIYGNPKITGTIFVILAGVVFYYLYMSMTAVEIFAAGAFVALLMGLAFIAYSKEFLSFANVAMKRPIPALAWIISLIWVALSVWVIYSIYF